MDYLGKHDYHDPYWAKFLAKNYSTRYGEDFWTPFNALVGSGQRAVIADFGCGPGLWLIDAGKLLKAEKLHGLDASEPMLQEAKLHLQKELEPDNYELHLVDFDSADIPLENNTLDVSFSGYFLHEVANPRDFMKQAYAKHCEGGISVVFDFISGKPEEFLRQMISFGMEEEHAKKIHPHMCKHSLGEIEDILSSAGFSSISSIVIGEIRAVVVGIKRIQVQ